MKGKIIGIILVIASFLMTSAYAQEWPSAENIVAKIQADLNLNQEQFDKVKLIIEENMMKRKQITPQLPQGLTQDQSQALDSELYQKLSEVLTRTQMSQWNRILEVMLQEMSANQTTEKNNKN